MWRCSKGKMQNPVIAEGRILNSQGAGGWMGREGHDRAQQVTKWENVARSQCAALGIGELAGKMGCMDHPQQGTWKSQKYRLERNILVDEGWVSGTGCLRQNCTGKTVDGLHSSNTCCFFCPFSVLLLLHGVRGGTVHLVAEEPEFSSIGRRMCCLSAAKAGCSTALCH